MRLTIKFNDSLLSVLIENLRNRIITIYILKTDLPCRTNQGWTRVIQLHHDVINETGIMYQYFKTRLINQEIPRICVEPHSTIEQILNKSDRLIRL